MALGRVFTNPDGSVRVLRLNARHRGVEETETQFLERETAKQADLMALSFVDVDEAQLPSSRMKRHAWRVNPARTALIVDPGVPDPPHPRQALLDALDQATTIDQLKGLMKQMVR